MPSWWDTTFFIELFLLALAAPILYLPTRFPPFMLGVAFALLVATWLWRRVRLGVWFIRTPAAIPIFFLFLIMLPIAIWVAPEPLRATYTWPKVYTLCWSFCLFWTLISHAAYQSRLINIIVAGFLGAGMLIALTAPLGTNWLYKLPYTEPLLSHLPYVLSGLSREGGTGFHPNTIAGGLLFVYPLLVALTFGTWGELRNTASAGTRHRLLFVVLVICTLYAGSVLIIMQSRSGYIGLAVGLVAMWLIDYKWGRRFLLFSASMFILALFFFPAQLIEWLGDTPVINTVGGAENLTGFRANLWQQTFKMIYDFPVTGVGLGIFQEVAYLFYPVTVSPGYHLGHAHNFWLQTAVDFGLPGLLAVLWLYSEATWQLTRLHQAARHTKIPTGYVLPKSTPVAGREFRSGHFLYPSLIQGLIGSFIAQSIYSLTDSISMGATANLLFWYLFALIFMTGYHLVGSVALEQQPVSSP